VLQVYAVEGGKLKARPHDAASLGAAVWIDLADPTGDEQSVVERATGIHIQTPDELDRFYISDQLRTTSDQLMLNALLVTGVNEHQPNLVPVTFIRSKGPLVTVSKGSKDGLAWLVAECEESLPTTSKDIFPVILDMIIDHAINVLDHVSGDLDRLNRALFQHHNSPKRRLQLSASPRRRNHQLELILTELGYCREVLVKLRRSALSFRRLIGLLRERVSEEGLAKKLEAFGNELQAIAEAEVDLSSTASFMLDGAVGFIGIMQNQTVNILTVVGTLLTPPVLVASIYGMNFKNMPELQWEWGYLWALALMVISGLAMYAFVRARGWL
jgi:magnesium transporter